MGTDRLRDAAPEQNKVSDDEAVRLIQENNRLRTIEAAQANSPDLEVHPANLFGKNEITIQSDEDAIAALEIMKDIASKSPREIAARKQREDRVKQRKPASWHQ